MQPIKKLRDGLIVMYIDNKYHTQQIAQSLSFLKRLHNILQVLAQSASQFSWEYIQIKCLRRKNLQPERTAFALRC